MNNARTCTVAALAAGMIGLVSPVLGSTGELTLDTSVGLAAAAQPDAAKPTTPAPAGQPVADPAAPAKDPEITPAKIAFGRAGSNWWRFGAGYMHDAHQNGASNIYAAYSHFLADEIEFSVELDGWYFTQDGKDTGGINPLMDFRWHFLHDDAFDWTVFAEAGIGLLFAFDEVPDGGTGFNFTPRAGVGFTKDLGCECGARLELGVRWQHISNGRIEGDDRNPGRDSIMGYAGVIFPF